jgi:hypothetical protein
MVPIPRRRRRLHKLCRACGHRWSCPRSQPPRQCPRCGGGHLGDDPTGTIVGGALATAVLLACLGWCGFGVLGAVLNRAGAPASPPAGLAPPGPDVGRGR